MIVSETGLELSLFDFSDKVIFQGFDGFIAFLIVFNFHDKIVFSLSFPIPIPHHIFEQSIAILLFQTFRRLNLAKERLSSLKYFDRFEKVWVLLEFGDVQRKFVFLLTRVKGWIVGSTEFMWKRFHFLRNGGHDWCVWLLCAGLSKQNTAYWGLIVPPALGLLLSIAWKVQTILLETDLELHQFRVSIVLINFFMNHLVIDCLRIAFSIFLLLLTIIDRPIKIVQLHFLTCDFVTFLVCVSITIFETVNVRVLENVSFLWTVLPNYFCFRSDLWLIARGLELFLNGSAGFVVG